MSSSAQVVSVGTPPRALTQGRFSLPPLHPSRPPLAPRHQHQQPRPRPIPGRHSASNGDHPGRVLPPEPSWAGRNRANLRTVYRRGTQRSSASISGGWEMPPLPLTIQTLSRPLPPNRPHVPDNAPCEAARAAFYLVTLFGWTGKRPVWYPARRRTEIGPRSSSATHDTGVLAVKQPYFLLKLAAVVSSGVLAGGYVCYRAGAFDASIGFANRVGIVAPSPTPPQQPTPASGQPAPIIMSGSKSMVISSPALVQDSSEAPPPPIPSDGPLPPLPVPPPSTPIGGNVPPPPPPVVPPPAPEQQTPTIFSGPKTGFNLNKPPLPPRFQPPLDPQQPTPGAKK